MIPPACEEMSPPGAPRLLAGKILFTWRGEPKLSANRQELNPAPIQFMASRATADHMLLKKSRPPASA